MRRPAAAAAGLCLVLALAACGSTVQQTGVLSTDQGLGTAPVAGSAPTSAAPGSTGTDAIGAAPGTVSSGTTGGGSTYVPGQQAGSTSGGPGPVAPTAGSVPIRGSDPVLIGFATEKDITSVAASLGISGISGGDLDAQLAAVVNDINAHGGLAGHKVKVLEHDFNTQSRIRDPAGAAQAACADWTQDHHVFAVVDTYVVIALLPGMLDCLAKAGVPLISDWPTDDANNSEYASHPLVISPSSMTVDSYIPAEIDRLYANGFFSGWNTRTGRPGPAPVKVGTESFDTPAGQHYVAVLRAALASHGLKLDAVESHDPGPSGASAGASAAVLQFRSKGVTHVFYANIAFYEDAQSQGYHPRYSVDDLIGPALLAQNVGAAQLHGAMGAGYQPLNEVAGAKDPNAEGARCLATMRRAGQRPDTQLAKLSMFQMCAHWYLLQRIFEHAPALTLAAFRTGVEGLGTGYVSPSTYGTSFGPRRHFGAAYVRDYIYVDSCRCFRFTSPTLHRAS